MIDSFPKDFQNNYFESKLKSGFVLKVKGALATTKTQKILILLSNTNPDYIGFVPINSSVNTNFISTFDKEKCILPLEKTPSREFLDKNSYVDCNNIIDYKVDKLRRLIDNDNDWTIYDIEDEDLNQVKITISKSKSITDYQREAYNLPKK